jgi:hypothetical protein
MGIGAIVLAVFAFVCMVAGALLSLVPFLGTLLSFLAPVLALAGIILGGVALSRSRAGGGESEGLAIGGLVANIVAFVPSMLLALVCGTCNVCVTGVFLDPNAGTYDGGVMRNGPSPTTSPFPGPGTTPTMPPPTTYAPAPTFVAPTTGAPTPTAMPAPTVISPTMPPSPLSPTTMPPTSFVPPPTTQGALPPQSAGTH